MKAQRYWIFAQQLQARVDAAALIYSTQEAQSLQAGEEKLGLMQTTATCRPMTQQLF